MTIEDTTAAEASRIRIMQTPLAVAERETGTARVVVAADKFTVATINIGMNDRTEYARLFAASPDLLAALRAIVWQALQGKVLPRDACVAQARAAIAKAEGRAP
jgi:hypothetical protein